MSFSHTSNVPIHMLPGIGIRTAEVLQSLGIRTVGQFKQLPEGLLVEIFGPSIRSLHQYVRGPVSTKRETQRLQARRYKMPITKKFQFVSHLLAVL